MKLATTFANTASVIQSATPLSDDEIRRVAPSIFASEAHASRSSKYTYIPTNEILNGLRGEGFQPFMACQARVRNEHRLEFTKHMLRLRHVSQIVGAEANEIILVNSHDGSSSYQMLAGVFRFVCRNGLICGDTVEDLRIPHRGDIVGEVIDGAYQILDQFKAVDSAKDEMKALVLRDDEQVAFARAALTVRYDGESPPISERQALNLHRSEDSEQNLWSTFNVVQENLIRGGLRGRSQNGRRNRTRPVTGIDQNVRLNRALWVLAEEMRKLKAA